MKEHICFEQGLYQEQMSVQEFITFAGIEKTYGIENIKIRCVPRSTID